MGVDVSHLVLESLGNTDDKVVDQSADSSEGSDILAGTVVKLNVDDVLLWVGEVDCEMVQVLAEFSCKVSVVVCAGNSTMGCTSGSLNSHKTRLDADLD